MTAEPGSISRALLVMAGDDIGPAELATRFCRACVAGTAVDGAAISLLTASVHRETLAATDATAATLEDLQYTLGEGACIDAAVSGRPVLVSDVHDPARTARWPVFAAAVTEQTSARALFALPLQLGTINLGVLDLYRDTPGPLRDPALRDVVAATDTATLLLLGRQLVGGTDHHAEEQLDRVGAAPDGELDRDGLAEGRAEVHQATGMIIAQLDIPAQDAFVRLRAYAFAHHRPLGEVARDVVARRLVFTPDMG